MCQYGTSRKQTEWQAQAAGTQLLGVQGRQIVFARNLYSWPWVAEHQTQDSRKQGSASRPEIAC